jgi:hypothetical protein
VRADVPAAASASLHARALCVCMLYYWTWPAAASASLSARAVCVCLTAALGLQLLRVLLVLLLCKGCRLDTCRQEATSEGVCQIVCLLAFSVSVSAHGRWHRTTWKHGKVTNIL